MAHSGWYHVHFLFWPWRRDGGRFPSLRGASRSLASVRMASKSKNKPPTTSSDGHESY